jgi:DNA-binding NarL/FixJ family response regulator
MMAEGLSDEAISERTSIPREEVEGHITTISTKLGLESSGGHGRVQAVLTYLRA